MAKIFKTTGGNISCSVLSTTGQNAIVLKGLFTSPYMLENLLNKFTISITDNNTSIDQAWFWEKEWIDGEKEAEKEFATGKGVRFKNSNEAIEFLKGTR